MEVAGHHLGKETSFNFSPQPRLGNKDEVFLYLSMGVVNVKDCAMCNLIYQDQSRSRVKKTSNTENNFIAHGKVKVNLPAKGLHRIFFINKTKIGREDLHWVSCSVRSLTDRRMHRVVYLTLGRVKTVHHHLLFLLLRSLLLWFQNGKTLAVVRGLPGALFF